MRRGAIASSSQTSAKLLRQMSVADSDRQLIEAAIAQYAAGDSTREQLDRLVVALCAADPAAREELAARIDALPKPKPSRAGGSAAQTRLRTAPAGDNAPAAELPAPPDAQSAPPPEHDAPRVGRLLNGKYRLEQVLGMGGMGVVFLAQDLIGREPVAIKILRAELQTFPDIIGALRDEVKQTRKLRHENIVGVYALEQDGADPYIVMEYLQGKTLRSLLDEDYVRGLPFTRAWPIIQGIGDALAFAHDRGVIHSDLKPENIFLTVAGIPKVLDFGIARAIRNPSNRFGERLSAFTPGYASCELIEGETPDFSDDVYGFACVVYEILTGRCPFGGNDGVSAREQHLEFAPVPGLSAAQNGTLRRALAFRRKDRIASVEEFLLGLAATAPRSRKLSIASAVAAATIVGLAAWWVLRRPDEAPSAGGRATTVANQVARKAGEVFSDCARNCPSMVVIPTGKFLMGSPPDEPGRRDDEILREIIFSHPFALSQYPVTKHEFRAFLAETGYQPASKCQNLTNAPSAVPLTFDEPGFAQTDNDPAVCVSIGDARAYAAWISSRLQAQLYRMPSEAEWEYAARAGTQAAVPWAGGDSAACRFGNFADHSYDLRAQPSIGDPALCDDAYAVTSPVGSFPRNPWGLFDMLGNVYEWTESCNRQLDATNGDAFLTNCKKFTVIRGAGFSSAMGNNLVRFARRMGPVPETESANNRGFRLARPL